MALESGTRLGPYEVLEPIGSGGMGDVYRGRDTRLERNVAIKILPSLIAADPDVRKRFELEAQVLAEIIQPVATAMVQEGSPFRGVLYLGMIVTAAGPKVIEFNSRLGDPEAQVILPRLKSDLAEVMMSAARGTLPDVAIEWDTMACVSVVVASGGYPDDYRTGYEISGLDEQTGAVVFHAGTKAMPGANGSGHTVVTNGGRVLSVMARGGNMSEAREAAYAGVQRIRFKDSFYRRDIAAIEQLV